MSQMAGVFSEDEDLADKLATILEVFHPQSITKTNPKSKEYQWLINSVVGSPDGSRVLAEVSLPIAENPFQQPYIDHENNLVFMYDGKFYNSREVASRLKENHHLTGEKDGALIAHLFRELPGSLEEKVRRALKYLDGDYALAVSSPEQTVIARNSLGTKPLYFAEGGGILSFASNKKALWQIGFDDVIPLRAGTLAVFDQEGIKIKKAWPIEKGEIEIEDMTQAVDRYQEAIYSAVKKRLSGIDKAGVLLSGGVDSCLLAKLVHDIGSPAGIKTIAYTAGFADSTDIDFARRFAEETTLNHKVKVLSIDKVEEYIPKVIEAVEERDFVQIEAGIGIYAALDMAVQDGIRVVFAGQGADELWGGYDWYPEVLNQEGSQGLSQRMLEDIYRGDIETLDRENKMARAHGIEMIFPYLDAKVVTLAMSVAPQLKVFCEDDHLGKHPHRQLAQRIGISAEYAKRSKDAAQHGTGIHGVLDEISRKNGFNADNVKSIGYSSDKVTTEKLGSSSRYGYQYAQKSLWQVPQNVQFFFDMLAYEKGLLNKLEREKIKYFLDRMRFNS